MREPARRRRRRRRRQRRRRRRQRQVVLDVLGRAGRRPGAAVGAAAARPLAPARGARVARPADATAPQRRPTGAGAHSSAARGPDLLGRGGGGGSARLAGLRLRRRRSLSRPSCRRGLSAPSPRSGLLRAARQVSRAARRAGARTRTTPGQGAHLGGLASRRRRLAGSPSRPPSPRPPAPLPGVDRALLAAAALRPRHAQKALSGAHHGNHCAPGRRRRGRALRAAAGGGGGAAARPAAAAAAAAAGARAALWRHPGLAAHRGSPPGASPRCLLPPATVREWTEPGRAPAPPGAGREPRHRNLWDLTRSLQALATNAGATRASPGLPEADRAARARVRIGPAATLVLAALAAMPPGRPGV